MTPTTTAQTASGLRIAALREYRNFVGGRWVSVHPECPHGTRAGYSYYSCRCTPCGAAEQTYRNKLRRQPIPRRLHGTVAGRNRGCTKRCCRTAARVYDHERYIIHGPRLSRAQAQERGVGTAA